ncbi:hypothetical protein BX616_004233 [Lobosporangium transversale]|uniref:Uncharacterized protein n=1 Tax=Lobosporangium transversale TaxID=64571 RepID=A0A1Y2GNZ2_9FUNG|nr:hypothetical protein BCR41DRAFT_352464 [Lobosporangium transversale]KAF9898298.1 hypothetical protein BX616_004233 [Lobosporangium transversale]ORZ17419.1 hypothetical protein BCR41DRAFT_352464 [Lobosporangium transversale]|eukprot:XP_021881806.1 hypothetical protein BCR41DRAFT_352464 [Lobosporangium transversale]
MSLKSHDYGATSLQTEGYPGSHPVAAVPAPAPSRKPRPKPPIVVTTTHTAPVMTSTLTTSIDNLTSSIDPVQTSLTTDITVVPSNESESSSGSISNPKSTTNVALIAGIATGAVALLILIAGLLFRAKRKREQEARDTELYQQLSMMRKYSESPIPHGFANNDGTESNVALFQQQQRHYPPFLQQRLAKQPAWFAKKSPLEYHSQVPPLGQLEQQDQEHRQLQQHQQQKQEIGSTTHSPKSTASSSDAFTQQEAVMAPKNVTSSNTKPPIEKAITPYPASTSVLPSSPPVPETYHQQDYRQPRTSTQIHRQPSSPSGSRSPLSSKRIDINNNNNNNNNNNSTNNYHNVSPYRVHPTVSSSIVSPSPVIYQGAPSTTTTADTYPVNNNFQDYMPPPPLTGQQDQSRPSPSQPPAGFYDLLNDSSLLEGTGTNKPVVSTPLTETTSTTATIPPPVPKATRPASVASRSSFMMASENVLLDPSASDIPAVPPLPSHQ